jgi:hypothetical protein
MKNLEHRTSLEIEDFADINPFRTNPEFDSWHKIESDDNSEAPPFTLPFFTEEDIFYAFSNLAKGRRLDAA